MQNSTLAETLVMASQGIDLKVTKGGQLDGGQKVFMQLELPDEHIGNSGIKRWLTALNSHDGSSSVGFGSTSTVVICQNTFYKAFKDLSRFRHTASAKERIDMAMEDLKLALQHDAQLMTIFKRMADTKADDNLLERLVKRIFEVDARNTKSSEVSAVKRNQLDRFSNAMHEEVSIHDSTVWAMFNGVTRYTNHHALNGKASAEKRESYVMVGGGARVNILGFNECMKWLEENTKKVYQTA
jgi:hypothetical protein